jgi:hypothetical protein
VATVSTKHALNEPELRFCRAYLALGKKNASEAYRRSHLLYYRGAYYDTDDKGERSGDPVKAKDVGRRAGLLLRQDHIQRYLAELEAPTSDHARSAMADQVLFGDEQSSLRAAQHVLADEDKLGFRDAVERYAEIMCEIGAEVVVPLPSKVSRVARCPHCFEEHKVEFDLEVTVPFKEMFPPPQES